jgi:hypothetical protein
MESSERTDFSPECSVFEIVTSDGKVDTKNSSDNDESTKTEEPNKKQTFFY